MVKRKRAALLAAKIQLMYMGRPNCHILAQKPRNTIDDKRWLSHCKYLERIGENLKEGGIDENGELWMIIMARVVVSCKYGPERRWELLEPCIAAIDVLLGRKILAEKGDG